MLQDDAVPTVRRPVVILNALGLHFRPAGQFVDLARRFAAEIRVHRDGLGVDGKSILDLAMLAAGCGTHLELEARGPDAEVAIAALADLVAARFREGEEAARGDLAADGLGNMQPVLRRTPRATDRIISGKTDDGAKFQSIGLVSSPKQLPRHWVRGEKLSRQPTRPSPMIEDGSGGRVRWGSASGGGGYADGRG
jgi:phosphocarrier protein HPr